MRHKRACSLLQRSADTHAGLVIVQAVYGRSDDVSGHAFATVPSERLWDATIPLQALVVSSQVRLLLRDKLETAAQLTIWPTQLVIPGGRSKGRLLGMHDLAIGERKALRLWYRFRDKLHEVTVADREALAAPVRAHACN